MFKTRIGFLPSSWDAWNKDNWAEKMKGRCLKGMEGIPGLEIVTPTPDLTRFGCVSDKADAAKAVELFKRENIQGLIIGNMNFGMEVAVGAVLNQLPKDLPILHFCTRSAPFSKDGVRGSDTWCGSFMTSAAIMRRGFKFVHINTCEPEDEYFKDKIGTFTRAVCAISRFRGAKFAQLGTRPELFESQNYSEQALQKQFSQMIIPMDNDAIFSRIEALSPEAPEVKAKIKELTAGVKILEKADDTLVNLARYELTLLNLARELDVSAIAPSCWTGLQERFHIAACSTFGRLNNQGVITSCEVDVLGAITMWAMHCASLGAIIPDFIDWTDLHPSEENVWLAWHCGNAAGSLCAEGCQQTLQRNIQLIQWCKDCYGASFFRLKPGPVTCGRLVEYDGEFTMFYGTGEVVDLPPYTTGTYGWVKVNDVFDWEQKMARNGIIHHGVLIHDSKVAEALDMFCEFLNIKAVRGA